MNDHELQKVLGFKVWGRDPRPRMVGGALVAGAGGVMFLSSLLKGLLAAFPVAMLLVGAAIGLQGFGEHRRRRRLAVQMTRAVAELPQLRDAVRSLPRGGANPTQILQQRGYSEFFVRRWILKQLDDTA